MIVCNLDTIKIASLNTEDAIIPVSRVHVKQQEHLAVSPGDEGYIEIPGPSGKDAALLQAYLQPVVRELRCPESGPQAHARPQLWK